MTHEVEGSRPPGRPPGRGADSKTRVVEVAIRLFAEKGYHGTGVAEIGKAAGLQSGALYYHIGSKEELLFLVLRRHLDSMLEAEEGIAESDISPSEKLRGLITHHARVIAEHKDEVRIFFRDVDALTDERAEELQELRERIQSAWRRVFDEGLSDGSFRTANHALVSGMLGLVNNMWMWYRPDGKMTPEQLGDLFTEVFLHGVAKEVPATRDDAALFM